MNQSFEVQLQVVQRALTDVVMPALGDAGSQVTEQLGLSLATLAFMQQRLPYARKHYRQIVASYVDMAEAIATSVADHADADASLLKAAIEQGHELLQDPLADVPEYRIGSDRLRESVCELVLTLQSSPHEEVLDRLVAEHSGMILMRERAWCAPLGFEINANGLPNVDPDLN